MRAAVGARQLVPPKVTVQVERASARPRLGELPGADMAVVYNVEELRSATPPCAPPCLFGIEDPGDLDPLCDGGDLGAEPEDAPRVKWADFQCINEQWDAAAAASSTGPRVPWYIKKSMPFKAFRRAWRLVSAG